MDEWQIISMELDNPAALIGDYFEYKLLEDIDRIRSVKGSFTNSKNDLSSMIQSITQNDDRKKLVVYGSGFYHHYTYLLCKHADRLREEYGYIHFDHHIDF